MKLPRDAFAAVVRDTPLVSIDLIVEDEQGRVLLGLRRNQPAADSWFVPGGRIRKNETLDDACSRLTREELGLSLARADAAFAGVYEHFYDDNALGEPGYGTHYVVLAYRVQVIRERLRLPTEQHRDYRWFSPEELRNDPGVHPNSRAYAGGATAPMLLLF